MPPRRHRSATMLSVPSFWTTTAAAALFFLLAVAFCCGSSSAAQQPQQPPLLDEASVVLITGCAGFLGSELALALHTVYNVQKILCVDHMGDGTAPLQLKEFKRQRVFRLLQRTAGSATQVYFYRVDFRPSVPEFFDSSEVPVLEHIFVEHGYGITHVVHLADDSAGGGGSSNAENGDGAGDDPIVPRTKAEHEKAGLMESLLEQCRRVQREAGRRPVPQLVYASSHAVYRARGADRTATADQNPNPPPFSEAKPLTTPQDFAGARKLADELLAMAYGEAFRLPSIGLRFFDVYGPWAPPGSPVFQLAERAVAAAGSADENENSENENSNSDLWQDVDPDAVDSIRDFVFIDDAVDALLAAMQFTGNNNNNNNNNNPAVVVNVGTGRGTSVRQLAALLMRQGGGSDAEATDDAGDTSGGSAPPTISYADTQRARQLLGFVPQVSLQEGLQTTLAWHYDRAFPYHNKDDDDADAAAAEGDESETATENQKAPHSRRRRRRRTTTTAALCENKHDADCLRGTPVFACASECAHPRQCARTLWDDVLVLTRAVTAQCDVVLYTVSLDPNLEEIPSTHVRVSTQSIAYVESSRGGGGHCNLALVASGSPLYRTLSQSSTTPDAVVQHGYWSLIPVEVTEFTNNNANQRAMLELLPKLSPGLFFGPTVRKAVYADPNVIIDNLPRLLQESSMQPHHARVPGATALLIGAKKADAVADQRPRHATTESVEPHKLAQESAYRTIRMAVIDEMVGDGFAQQLDTGLLVHALRANSADADDDLRLFRCDVFAEIVQWRVDADAAAVEFILGLHDMWSRVVVPGGPWWIGDAVSTVPEGATAAGSGRRLQEVVVPPKEDGATDGKDESTDEVDETDELEARQLTEEEAGGAIPFPDDDADEDKDETTPDSTDPEAAQQDQSDLAGGGGGEHNGFGVVQGALEAVFGYGSKPQPQQRFERPGEEDAAQGDEADDFVVDDDDDAAAARAADGAADSNAGDELPQFMAMQEQDPSAYDVWMGVLSSTPLRFFGRIVALEAVGVYRVTDQVDDD